MEDGGAIYWMKITVFLYIICNLHFHPYRPRMLSKIDGILRYIKECIYIVSSVGTSLYMKLHTIVFRKDKH